MALNIKTVCTGIEYSCQKGPKNYDHPHHRKSAQQRYDCSTTVAVLLVPRTPMMPHYTPMMSYYTPMTTYYTPMMPYISGRATSPINRSSSVRGVTLLQIYTSIDLLITDPTNIRSLASDARYAWYSSATNTLAHIANHRLSHCTMRRSMCLFAHSHVSWSNYCILFQLLSWFLPFSVLTSRQGFLAGHIFVVLYLYCSHFWYPVRLSIAFSSLLSFATSVWCNFSTR